jgi:hypothetical protein
LSISAASLDTPGPQLISHLAPLLTGRRGIVLGEGGADPGGDDAALGFAGIRHGVAHEVDTAPLPGGAERVLSSMGKV